jgi:two-component system cell cycle response regulator CtrA
MRVLLIESDLSAERLISLMLRIEGLNLAIAADGEWGADLARRDDFDVILLAWELADMLGAQVLRDIRAAGVKTPVIVLALAAGIAEKVKALTAGADDYLVKPFHRDELVARIRAVVRRAKGHAVSALTIGDITVNIDRKLVDVRGLPVRLTGKEYQMLEIMALRRGSTITKEMFLNHLYGGRDEPELKIIDVFICNLRKKLRAAGARTEIETSWGRGYALREPAAAEISADRPGRGSETVLSSTPPGSGRSPQQKPVQALIFGAGDA